MSTGVPAHVVGQKALGIADPTAAKAALVDALRTAWPGRQRRRSRRSPSRTTVTSTPRRCPTTRASTPGSARTTSSAFTDDGTMTFEAREDYTWGPQPKMKTIVYSIIGDPTAAVQAMENEEIDIIQPQATADILTQLEGIADRGVEVIQGDGATYEHIDLAENNGGPFDPRPTAAMPRRRSPCAGHSSTRCPARTSSTG